MRIIVLTFCLLNVAAGTSALAQDSAGKPASKPLDLSTPYAAVAKPAKADAPRPAPELGKNEFGQVDLGDGGKLILQGSRKTKDAVHEATGFDQDPGSSTFRSLAPAQKSGTPPYVGFKLSTPTN